VKHIWNLGGLSIVAIPTFLDNIREPTDVKIVDMNWYKKVYTLIYMYVHECVHV